MLGKRWASANNDETVRRLLLKYNFTCLKQDVETLVSVRIVKDTYEEQQRLARPLCRFFLGNKNFTYAGWHDAHSCRRHATSLKTPRDDLIRAHYPIKPSEFTKMYERINARAHLSEIEVRLKNGHDWNALRPNGSGR